MFYKYPCRLPHEITCHGVSISKKVRCENLRKVVRTIRLIQKQSKTKLQSKAIASIRLKLKCQLLAILYSAIETTFRLFTV